MQNYLLTAFSVMLAIPEAAPNYTFIQAQERVKKMRRRRFPGQPLDIGQVVVLTYIKRKITAVA